MLRNTSYRYKLPMYMLFASALTAFIAIMVVSWQYYKEGKHSISIHSHELGSSMSGMLASSLKHKDIWRAYSLLRGEDDSALKIPSHIFILFDGNHSVFVSNMPSHFPTGTHVSEIEDSSIGLFDSLKKAVSYEQYQELHNDQHLITMHPLLLDGVVLGNLVIIDSYDAITSLFNKISFQGLLVILVTLVIITPFAWYGGKRIAFPLLNLESCILRVGKEPLDGIQCEMRDNHDEVGRLSRHFQNMIKDLKEKQDLENKVIESDRLAAVGTLAASVAHEINNPLAGMMMAIDTYKRNCIEPACKQREEATASIDLIERGLTQIQETVSSLLSSVNVFDKSLSRVDIEDIFKLVSPNSSKKHINFKCNNEIHDTVNISSTYVRQILINLLLNAIHATKVNGHISCHSIIDNDQLCITIKNDGDPIPEGQMAHLFDPYYSSKFTGSGLGLWVTQQITENLNGTIQARREDGWTIFEVKIPIHK